MLTMSGDQAMQSWCVLIQYDGKRPLVFGTVFARHGAPLHEREALAYAAIERVLPCAPPPRIVSYQPGMLVFVPPEDGGVDSERGSAASNGEAKS